MEEVLRWRESMTPREKALHDLAAVKLKKSLHADANDGDQGSYFPERSKAFLAWQKTQSQKAK